MDDDVVLSAPLFATMDADETRTLFESMQQIELSRGDVLFREGEPGDRLYVIASGKIKLGRRSNDGRENLLSILGPGEMFGELSLFDPGPRTATASSVADSVIYELGHDQLVEWIEKHPSVAKHLLNALPRRPRPTPAPRPARALPDGPARGAQPRRDLSTRFGEETDEGIRVAHDLTQEELAQLVGASRETVNKALADFATRGWVRREGRAVVLLDMDRLERRAR